MPNEAGYLTDQTGAPVGTAANPIVTTGGGGGGSSNVNLTQVATVNVVTAAAGLLKVGISGATGTTLDGTAGTPSTGVLTIQGAVGGTAVPVSFTPSGTQNVNVAQVNGITVLTGAGATGTGSQRVTAAQDTTTIAGSAPGTAGTASANVVTVQGIASMTSLIVSQATAANLNAAVVGIGVAGTPAGGVLSIQGVASGTVVPVTGTVTATPGSSSTATNSNVAGSASSVTVLASNASRKGGSVYNDSSAILYLNLAGNTASTTNYTTQLAANAFYEIPGPQVYTGTITGIWASAAGAARVTELT